MIPKANGAGRRPLGTRRKRLLVVVEFSLVTTWDERSTELVHGAWHERGSFYVCTVESQFQVAYAARFLAKSFWRAGTPPEGTVPIDASVAHNA